MNLKLLNQRLRSGVSARIKDDALDDVPFNINAGIRIPVDGKTLKKIMQEVHNPFEYLRKNYVLQYGNEAFRGKILSNGDVYDYPSERGRLLIKGADYSDLVELFADIKRNGERFVLLYGGDINRKHFNDKLERDVDRLLSGSSDLESVCYGREDLLRVAEAMADEFGNSDVDEELCGVMADAAYEFLSQLR